MSYVKLDGNTEVPIVFSEGDVMTAGSLNDAFAYVLKQIVPPTPLVKCKHCGQWAAVFTACKHCGAPVDPADRKV